MLGSILAALVVLALPDATCAPTLIAAVAIPTSIIATFGLIWYMGFTLNSMTMLALTLAVGIVIDDAIVVLENIYRFIEEKQIDPFKAAVEATQEIGLAVLAHDAVARRDLRAGRLHGRHRRPLHGELRPDDGVRDHGVAARQLHADADDGGALAQGRRPQRTGNVVEGLADLPRRRRVLHAGCSTGRWRTARHRRRAGGARAVSSVPLFMHGEQELPAAATTRREFEINVRAPEGHEPRIDRRSSPTGSRARSGSGCRRSTTRWSTVGGDPVEHAQPGDDLRAPDAARQTRRAISSQVMDSVRDRDPAAAARRTCGRRCSRSATHRRRRRRRTRDVQFLINGPDLKKLEADRPDSSSSASRPMPGVVDTDTSL